MFGTYPSSSTISRLTLASWSLEAEQPLLVARLDQFLEQMGGRGEAHAKALLAGGEAEGLLDNRQSNRRIKLHAVHPRSSPKTGKEA